MPAVTTRLSESWFVFRAPLPWHWSFTQRETRFLTARILWSSSRRCLLLLSATLRGVLLQRCWQAGSWEILVAHWTTGKTVFQSLTRTQFERRRDNHAFVQKTFDEDQAWRKLCVSLLLRVMLHVGDTRWMACLQEMDYLETIGLRGFGQRDPLVEYKTEAPRGICSAIKHHEDFIKHSSPWVG